MPDIRFIINPISGRGAGLAAVPIINKLAAQHSLNFEILKTQRPMQAVELAYEAVQNGCLTVAAVGGDGTANEVLNGLVLAKNSGKGDAALGIISVGRGNDFAYSIDIPKDINKGFNILVNGSPELIDLGFVKGGDFPQGRYFGNGVGIGFDTVVGFEAMKMKRLHGFLSYVIAALKTIYLYNCGPTLKIEAHNFEMTKQVLLLSIMNGRRMGGGFYMAPEGLNNDGLFDICIAHQVSRAQILRLIFRFMKGTQRGHPAIDFQQSSSLKITAIDGVLPVHADGETICIAGKRLTLDIFPQSIKILRD